MRRVMVTGAGGSIGSRICELLVADGHEVVLLSHSELTLYNIANRLRSQSPGAKVIPVLADVRSMSRINQVCQEHEPDIVYHAAAIKHVPIAEENPCEAILTNVVGTVNVVAAARKVVMVSTDKAVYPTSVMGATKRLAEIYAASRGATVVRFGNVWGSSGSVVPLFQRQIEAGGPVTVTDPWATRYFMSVEDAARLVIEAGDKERGLYVLDMGEPRRIIDVAKELIGDREIEINVTGLRPCEKLHETLFYDHEPVTRDGLMFRSEIRPVVGLEREIARIKRFAEAGNADAALRALAGVVSEYKVAA